MRLVGGLTVEEIARAFLSNEAAIAARITRAKKAIAKAGVQFEVPRGAELAARLPSVLEVVYLIFNEGYAATAGPSLIRPPLCGEAQRLGRILAGLMREQPEVLGLLALMEIQASRLAARAGPDGKFVPLTEQNRARWDQLLIRRGLDALERAEALGGANGPYALQAALAACHARARRAEDTDWRRIAALYDRLRQVMPSPVVELNRAVAHSMAFGPDAGLALVDAIRRRSDAAQLCAAARGARRFPAPRRSPRRGEGAVRSRGGAGGERPRTRLSVEPRRRLLIAPFGPRRAVEAVAGYGAVDQAFLQFLAHLVGAVGRDADEAGAAVGQGFDRADDHPRALTQRGHLGLGQRDVHRAAHDGVVPGARARIAAATCS